MFKEKIIDLLFDNDYHGNVCVFVQEYRETLDNTLKKEFDKSLILLLDNNNNNNNNRILEYAITLVGNYFDLIESKLSLLNLINKEFIYQNSSIVSSLLAAFNTLHIEESLPFIKEYLDTIFECNDYKGNSEVEYIAAINTMVEIKPTLAVDYLYKLQIYLDRFVENYAKLFLSHILANLLAKLGAEGVKELTQRFSSLNDNTFKLFLRNLEFSISFLRYKFEDQELSLDSYNEIRHEIKNQLNK